jgi:HAD superfamily hydrolase (TIGR01490 family)
MKLALFDLDNTLLAGDSDYAWADYLMDAGVIERAAYEERNRWFLAEYERGTIRMEDWLSFQLSPLAGRPRAELDRWHAEFMRAKVAPLILPRGRELLRRHAGDLRVIVTATNRFITAPIARELGVEHLIASEIEMAGDAPTGRPLGLPSFAAGKVTRLEEWLSSRGQCLADFAESWFYSDSHNDLPLLERVTHPVAVDPDARLRARARERGWPVISLRDAAHPAGPHPPGKG